MFKNLTGQAVRACHLTCLEDKAWPYEISNLEEDPIWALIRANHSYNSLLWNEEDLARRLDVQDMEIAQNKRNIDRYNQKRNDCIEKLDEAILELIPESYKLSHEVWVNSETVGSIIDRMSINALRSFNLEKQLGLKTCCTTIQDKLVIANYQGNHLLSCLDALLKAIKEGKAIFRAFRPLKLYNDPKLNPYLSGLYKTNV
jgi:hypothetical protein